MIDAGVLPKINGYIGGRWVGADSHERYSVVDPATGKHLADAPLMAEAECGRAISAAATAMTSPTTISERKTWLSRIAESLLIRKEALGRLITLEHGKPLREGIAEVEYSAGFYRYFATQLDELAPRTLAEPIRNSRWEIRLRPAGVVGAIASWNFPLAMISKKLAPAIGAGCGIVVKPASLTPLSAMALAHIVSEVGAPNGMVNFVIGKPRPIGKALCSHPDVRVISFTGSTDVGKELAASAAPHLKRLTMELGGNAPFLVFADADLTQAAEALLTNKFRAGGQTCVCANRVLVERSVHREFVDLISERIVALRMGNGLDDATDIGPLINRDGFDKVANHVADAIENGATRIVGGDPPRPANDWGCFYPPTLLTGIMPCMRVSCEETFGPVVAVSEFDNEDQALNLAASTSYGLAAYIFTNDERRVERAASALQCGHVGVNTGTGPTPEAPFGGMKQSGYGREGGLEGLLEFCEPQAVVHG